MKTSLLVAAALALAAGLTALPASAAPMASKTGVEARCYVLPGLPECISEWRSEAAAHGWHWKPVPNAWWTCRPAAKGAAHLLDCDAE